MRECIEHLPSDNPRLSYDSSSGVIASGGYCSVYSILEFDSVPRNDLVIKRLKNKAPFLGREKTAEEIRLLGKLDGLSSVPRVAVSDTEDRRPWFVMEELFPLEYIGVSDVLRVITEIAGALKCIHARGIAHRDVKLENILQRSDGSVVICDYGISVDADTPESIFDYWCPVNRRYDVPDEMMTIRSLSNMPVEEKIKAFQSSDIYMFGFCIHELLTGVRCMEPERDFVRFSESVSRNFGYGIGKRAAAFLFKAVTEATRKSYSERCTLDDLVGFIGKAKSVLDGRKLSTEDAYEADRIIRKGLVAGRIRGAESVVFDSPDDINVILDPFLEKAVLVHEERVIVFDRISIHSGIVTLYLDGREIRFSVGKLTCFMKEEGNPMFRIETADSRALGLSSGGIMHSLQRTLAMGGEVIEVFSAPGFQDS